MTKTFRDASCIVASSNCPLIAQVTYLPADLSNTLWSGPKHRKTSLRAGSQASNEMLNGDIGRKVRHRETLGFIVSIPL